MQEYQFSAEGQGHSHQLSWRQKRPRSVRCGIRKNNPKYVIYSQIYFEKCDRNCTCQQLDVSVRPAKKRHFQNEIRKRTTLYV